MPIYMLQRSVYYYQASERARTNFLSFLLLQSAPWPLCNASKQLTKPITTVNTETQCSSKTNAYYPDIGLAKTQTAQCYSQTQTTNPSHYAHYLTQTTGYVYAAGSTPHSHGHDLGLTHNQHVSTHGHYGLTQNHGFGLGHPNSCNGMATASGRHCGRRGENKRRGLFQRMKDGLSGDTSCSSSDSESDNEHYGARGFCMQNC